MVNVYRKHVWVIPEDDRNRQLATGFINHPAIDEGQIYPLPVARGWAAVLKQFEEVYVRKLREFAGCHVVLLIDYDNDFSVRRSRFAEATPADVADRVFVLGCANEPEALKKAVKRGGFEELGRRLADECASGAYELWMHDHLRHNEADRARLSATVRPFLFT